MANPQTGAGDPKRSMELLWRELEPQQSRPGPKPKLTVDRIARAAITIADREGIGAVNMRCVATELDVGTMTLYRYVPGKGELIDLMVDLVSDPGDEVRLEGKDWRETLETYADESLDFYELHPWMLEVNQRRPVLGPGNLAGFNLALSAFDDHDLPDREAILIVTAVWSIITGTAMSYLIKDVPPEQGGPTTTEEEWWETQIPYLERAVETGRYPRVAAITDHSVWDISPQQAMRAALDAYLDGIAPRMEATRKTPKST